MVSIISVNYNQPNATVDFLESVAKTTTNNHVEIILVDNGSSENHLERFRQSYPNLIYVRSEKNLGFAGGNNLGIEKASGEYLLFLNNDTELIEGMIDVLVSEFVCNEEIGLLSPLILYHDDQKMVQYAGSTKMNYLTGRNLSVGAKTSDPSEYLVSCETGFIHGAAMMCRKKDVITVGCMEENYFLYYEELDWCEKFKKAGKKMWFTGKTRIFHKESVSVGKESALKTYFMHRNRMLFIRKNTGPLNSLLFSFYYIFIATPKTIVMYYLSGRRGLIKYVLKAIIWNLSNSKKSNYLGWSIS